jgi:hypothetical protein
MTTRVTLSDMARAVRAADAGRVPRAVEIAPDGTIRIVPVEQVQPVKPVAVKREVVM